jgi:hypothetical protein
MGESDGGRGRGDHSKWSRWKGLMEWGSRPGEAHHSGKVGAMASSHGLSQHNVSRSGIEHEHQGMLWVRWRTNSI